jgi:hypothetical protein
MEIFARSSNWKLDRQLFRRQHMGTRSFSFWIWRICNLWSSIYHCSQFSHGILFQNSIRSSVSFEWQLDRQCNTLCRKQRSCRCLDKRSSGRSRDHCSRIDVVQQTGSHINIASGERNDELHRSKGQQPRHRGRFLCSKIRHR